MFSLVHKKIIVTAPPDSLSLVSFVLQLIGKNVYHDQRDDFYRPTTTRRFLIPVWKWCYNRLKNRCVTMKYFDPKSECIRHGYIVKEKRSDVLRDYMISKYSRMDHKTYYDLVSMGSGRDLSPKRDGEHKTSSSYFTLKQLGNKIQGQVFHREMYTFTPSSIEAQAKRFKKWLNK